MKTKEQELKPTTLMIEYSRGYNDGSKYLYQETKKAYHQAKQEMLKEELEFLIDLKGLDFWSDIEKQIDKRFKKIKSSLKKKKMKEIKDPLIKGMIKSSMIKEAKTSIDLDRETHTFEDNRAYSWLKSMPNEDYDYLTNMEDIRLFAIIERIYKQAKQEMLKKIDDYSDMRKEIDHLAEYLHINYELISQNKGWQTNLSCQTSFDALPKRNKMVMREVCRLIRKKICEELKSSLKEGKC